MNTLPENTPLHDLPDSITNRMDGPLYDILRQAGYDEVPASVINNNGWWNITVVELRDTFATLN